MINHIKNILDKHGIKASDELLKDLTQQFDQSTAELNEKYRRLTENSPEITYINNLNKGALYWSSKIKDILGFDPKNIVEDTSEWTKSLHPEDVPKIDKVLKNIKVGKTYEIEYRIYDINKNLHWFYDRIFNVYKKDGDLILEGIISDITERKKAEEQLKNQNILLNKLNATKDKFFSIIAHDLRGPMNNLVGFSDLLERNYQSYDNEKLSHIINLMGTSAKRTFSLLENLLIWARSQRNKLTYNPHVFICNELISEVIQDMEHLAFAKGIRFAANNKTIEYPVFVDKDMFITVYRNLISNAIKYTKEGGTISFGCRKVSDRFIDFFIKDDGVGIPKETIERLFKPDENITTEGTNQEHGTGLGLILCKDFIDKHGGKIWVESEVNKGSTFWFTFPVPEQN